MALSALPTELIALILSEAMPDGFESLMLSSRTIYQSGKSLIQMHNTLRSTYRRIALDQNLVSASALLQRVADEPIVAEYIQDLDCANLANLPPAVQPLSATQRDALACSEALRSFVARTQHKLALDVDTDAWLSGLKDKIQTESETPFLVFATILSALPNLRFLTPPNWQTLITRTSADTDRAFCERFLDTLVSRANDTVAGIKPLVNLTVVGPCCESGYDSQMPFQSLDTYLALPSVTHMSLVSCKAVDDGYTGDPFSWRYHELCSGIRALELANCCIAGPEMAQALRHMPHLRTLRYSHETKWHGCLHDWDAGAFISHVGKCSGDFLTDLSVTMPVLFGDWDGAAEYLKQFVVLRHLELDVRCLQRHKAVLDEFADCVLPTPSVQALLPPELDAEYALADVLPSSIESLRVIARADDLDHTFMQSLLADWPTRNAAELKNLERLFLAGEGQGEEDDTHWRALGDLVPAKTRFTYHEVDSMEPAWHEDFFNRYPDARE